MTDRDRGEDAYTGRAGQQAFIAQVLLRLGNAAVPVVDVGCDVVVFSDALPLYVRVQVKTSVVTRYADGSGHSTQFNLPLAQLEQQDLPPLFYALVTRDERGFAEVLLVPRWVVRTYWDGDRRFGTENRGSARLHVQFRDRVVCGEIDLTEYRNNWQVLPPFAHLHAATGNTGGT